MCEINNLFIVKNQRDFKLVKSGSLEIDPYVAL